MTKKRKEVDYKQFTKRGEHLAGDERIIKGLVECQVEPLIRGCACHSISGRED